MCHWQSQLTALRVTKSISANGRRKSVTCPVVCTGALIQAGSPLISYIMTERCSYSCIDLGPLVAASVFTLCWFSIQ